MLHKKELDAIKNLVDTGAIPFTSFIRAGFAISEAKRVVVAHLAAKYDKSEAFTVETFHIEFVAVNLDAGEVEFFVQNRFNKHFVQLDPKWKLGEKVIS